MQDRTQEPRTALVTGAGQRIGRAIALDLARAGWRVGVHYSTSREGAEAVVAAIGAAGGAAAALAADLSDLDAVKALVPACAARLGAPTLLVNSAAIFAEDRFDSVSGEQWDRQMAVNLRAPVFLAQAFAAHLPPAATGHIVNIIDQRVWRLTPEFFSYTTTKAALWAVTRTMAQALAPRIRVNAIGPGPVLASIHQTPADFAREVAATPLGRATPPDEIAAAIRFIVDAPSMTGQMIALDAGQHLAWSDPCAGTSSSERSQFPQSPPRP